MHDTNSIENEKLSAALLGDPINPGETRQVTIPSTPEPSKHRFVQVDAESVDEVYALCAEQGLKVLDVRRAPRQIAQKDIVVENGKVVGFRKPRGGEVFYVPSTNRYVAKTMEPRS